ncbi:MAG: TerC/Alx family metal homeostasis membrane protein [Prevotella salivae]|jgi:integral membrane protein, terC family|uniref:TerC/Alx family metal homeostasis membrane protein n=1 Tax=Segatella salivae TaxID=228604 RepID=UPI001CB05987|nr:TerC/Alx family metal homeostasis membrane protein [Segatella salivae]MBF1528892.1 TerC/Alx family metal homeostasis membrane protein [Segatella salivae]MBF1531968.1 TerC/Alx family metal homeostasis membrane protein [Segatella salivae]MBF1540723.1 TerC/Alx family metal homeostasis membrane protein [Segatella salivae]MBF1552186.1 TerC/Alx family metal homeostasis membrane protein [Segatella salivae]MBF1555614.1 TerC/Alx family metal homeostasis membrane protein [Segatella salivae]
MFSTEILFLIGFIVFIAGILILDMLVIDRKAHVVSIKEAGTWTLVWITLALAFSAFLWYYGDLVHGIHSYADLQGVASRYASHLKLNPNDFEASLQSYRHYMTISYLSGYLIEKTLSVDNLFVMMMIFTSFGVKNTEYQHVLNWGILGAIVLRFVFIFAGAAIINRFDWVLIVFGFVLVYSAYKMYRDRNKQESIDVQHHPMVKFLSKYFHVYPRFEGDNFFVRAIKKGNDYELVGKGVKGLLCITPLFVTVLVIEFSDLIFAFDSIPAVFSVSLDPYVVFFSNIFAILGLRAMFFLLAAIADKFRYLKLGVSVLLLFIGVKLLIHKFVEIDAMWSLVIILAVLVISIAASLLIKPVAEPNKQQRDNPQNNA